MRGVNRGLLARPSPTSAIAFVALLLALGGYAIAAPPADRGEVINTTATGSAESSAAGPVEIPLSTDTFTQKAGEVLLIAATADFQFNGNAETTGCTAEVELLEGTDPLASSLFGFVEHLQAGPPTHTASAAFPAPATDTTQTLTAVLTQRNSDDPQQGECVDLTTNPATPVDDTWTVSLAATATRLR